MTYLLIFDATEMHRIKQAILLTFLYDNRNYSTQINKHENVNKPLSKPAKRSKTIQHLHQEMDNGTRDHGLIYI